MSLLHFLFYIHSGGMIDMLVATGGGAQDSRIVGGSQTIALRAAEELGDAVRLGCPVHLIRQDADGVEVVHEHGSVRAERVIVALPPALAGRIRYSPALPGRRDQLTQQVPMGAVIKVQVRYDEPFWREAGLSGFVVSLDDPIGVMFDNSPQDLRSGVLLGFFEGEHATEAALMDAGARASSRWAASRSTSASVRCSRSSTSSRTGRPRSSRAAATAGAWGRACGRATRRRSASPWAGSTGPAPRRPTSGTATWTAPSAPASAPPRRRSASWPRRRWWRDVIIPAGAMTELSWSRTLVERATRGMSKMRRLRDRGGPEGTRYTMREKMFAVGDDFWIETEGGDRAFKVNGKALRVRDTLVIESRSGEELFTIQEKKLSVRDKMEVERSGQTVATVKKALVGLRDRFSIEVDGGGDLSAKGNVVDHEYEIERDGDKVAEVSKRWFRVRDAYGIEVAPGRTTP